ncbi:MAG: class I SAM-dependent methyltransferase [Cyclobacteriaceae bacterium]|nr:class I SAM-dependent methyltransferase [Cyclobacteriaceae bacterium]
MNLENVTFCPICSSTAFDDYIETSDFTTTGEYFKIVKCVGCQFLITSPRPTSGTISKYYQSEKYISHTGGRRTIVDRIYLAARGLTLNWKYKLLSDYHNQGAILDYGCGTGEFLHYLKQKNWTVHGVEPSEIARQKAIGLLDQEIASSLADVPTNGFQVITLWHVLEHIHELNETIQLLTRLLHKNGTIFIAVPNYESADAKQYQKHWAAYDVPRHLWHFSKETMNQLLQRNGLNVRKIKPMRLDAFYVSMLSEGYKNPDQWKLAGLLKAIVAGIASNFAGAKKTNYSSLIYIVKK